MSSPLDDSLRYEKSQIEDELKTLRKEIQECEAKCRKLETRLHHVDGLLGIGQDSPDTVPAKNGHPVLDLAVEILRERNGEPMYYRELHNAVVEMGGRTAGKDPANTLLSRISKDNRFGRPHQKGFYALREDYPDAENVGKRDGSIPS